MRVQSFKPVIHETCRILILGSMPGVKSLQEHQYYAHPRNHFWPILYGLFDKTPVSDYEQRLQFAQSKGFGLWDVLGECEREGSLDTNIQHAVPNDFAGLQVTYPQIHHFFFNGAKAYELFMRHCASQVSLEHVTLHKLPSTSPANTASLASKLEQWRTELQSVSMHSHFDME
ncbi:DNA-deoxyinosine glycosylase [Paenibacillus selenitireducens]|uniref:DNA-deoxyinosine glycosylase n=1 Tax=Paenibacillus selenitireducens TaxID=1324314 RepID=A0A1T2XLR3_9BACL|nr:DNA-deoxyinosine glycosylase [Paenibacillus selenitireducens]OPA80809.1 DNA-deoxyinosine glycosylase [Paenibacillus selenitireducens]